MIYFAVFSCTSVSDVSFFFLCLSARTQAHKSGGGGGGGVQRTWVGLEGLGPKIAALALRLRIREFGIVKVDIIHNSNNCITLYTLKCTCLNNRQKHVTL